MENLSASFFIKSRSKLKELLLPSSVVIVSSNRVIPRSGDQYYPFRQSSDLYYLTGIKEANCTLAIFPDKGPNSYSEVLYIPESDEKSLMWDGPKINSDLAKQISGIENIRYLKHLKHDILEFLSRCSAVYFGHPINRGDNTLPPNELEIRKDVAAALPYIHEHLIAPLMMRIRMYKEPEEIEMMRKAIAITGEAFTSILQELKPGMKEYELAALLTYRFQSQGAFEHAFDPIVASGKNALVLHYVENTKICMEGDLLLLDFGADWEYYAADISRTIPVSGYFDKRQRSLYEANLRVMNKAIKLMKPGILLKDFHREVGLLWEEEHVKLGLYGLNDIRAQSEGASMWQKYYWHGTSHSIGIEVHDPFDHAVVLKEGMVLSCEPGIYIPEEGVGIRLENDILITEGDAINLSESIPIDPDTIELIMNRK
ncbi:MAG: Xaa-Pro aminopeptidase [Bacteroidales bacterium]|jgi:Xaa-Pro aminopeptidase|nr:Xaa-Pro aminopeptidase [Bacteroidales bacterium]